LQQEAAWFACKESNMNNPAVRYDTGEFSSMSASSDLEIPGFSGIDDRQPEKRLMFAVLLDAVECYQKYASNETHRLFKDIEEWIIADDHEWLFSFVNICEAVDLNPNYLRNGLSQWKEQRSRKVTAGKKFAARAFPSEKLSRKISAKRAKYSRLHYPGRWPTEPRNQRNAVLKHL
jgi:hypothetical protein